MNARTCEACPVVRLANLSKKYPEEVPSAEIYAIIGPIGEKRFAPSHIILPVPCRPVDRAAKIDIDVRLPIHVEQWIPTLVAILFGKPVGDPEDYCESGLVRGAAPGLDTIEDVARRLT